jgi:hypothetical protein
MSSVWPWQASAVGRHALDASQRSELRCLLMDWAEWLRLSPRAAQLKEELEFTRGHAIGLQQPQPRTPGRAPSPQGRAQSPLTQTTQTAISSTHSAAFRHEAQLQPLVDRAADALGPVLRVGAVAELLRTLPRTSCVVVCAEPALAALPWEQLLLPSLPDGFQGVVTRDVSLHLFANRAARAAA